MTHPYKHVEHASAWLPGINSPEAREQLAAGQEDGTQAERMARIRGKVAEFYAKPQETKRNYKRRRG